MEVVYEWICQGCLCNDRKISIIDDINNKQCFLQIIWEVSAPNTDDVKVSLCWECEAHVRRFTKFKAQAQKSYKVLQNYAAKSFHKKATTKLKIHKQYNVCILPNLNVTELNICEVIKSENVHDSKIKQENDTLDSNDNSDLYSDDDNQVLIEISTKKKKDKHNVKKNRKKRVKEEENIDIKTELEYYKEVELSREEILEERKALELREDYVNALFRCEKCIISFPNEDDLLDHVRNKHELNASNYTCEICSCSFSSEVSLSYHVNKHARRLQCAARACSERFASKRAVARHYEIAHCARTDMEYELHHKSSHNGGTTEQKVDKSIKQDTPLFPCEFCDKTFRWKTSLRKHSETHRIETGQKRRPYCEPCRLSFTTTSNLQKHVKTSSKHQIQLKLRKLKETLPQDAASPDSQAHIEQIKSSINSVRQVFVCGQCDKRFQWRGNLHRHLLSHAARANGELVCEPCNRTFSSIATYNQHMKISKKHVSENDFKYMCSDCGKRFANKTRLKDHVDWEHLKNYVHKCPLCQKVFKSHTSLYLHKQVVHKKDSTEHLCDHCGKPFPNRGKLRSHVSALHAAAAAHTCAACGARFSWHSCLSRHVRRVHRDRLAAPSRAGGD